MRGIPEPVSERNGYQLYVRRTLSSSSSSMLEETCRLAMQSRTERLKSGHSSKSRQSKRNARLCREALRSIAKDASKLWASAKS